MDVGGLDHEHVTLPVAPGVPHPRAYVWGQPGTITDLDDARVVDHLSHDQHVVGGLHDRIVVVVSAVGEHRRTGIGTERHEATLSEWPHLRVVILGELPPELHILSPSRLSLGCHGRHPTVHRVGHERGSGLAIDDGHPRAPIPVDFVVLLASQPEGRPSARGRPWGSGAITVGLLEFGDLFPCVNRGGV